MAYLSAIAIFLGAFLLFLVQPILGKMILPWFGGTPAVWSTCMLFFQLLLLGGYAYAAVLTRVLKPRGQALVHAALLAAALALLPITPSGYWKPTDGTQPVARILVMLLACVGLPYFLLSATSPLVQTWFAHARPGQSPYRLYALSNVGSLGALLIYPLAIEPLIGTARQGLLWSLSFSLFMLVAALMAWRLRMTTKFAKSAPGFTAPTANDDAQSRQVTWLDRATWLGLPALASMMLLAVTNHLCQDVAVVPFLWIGPLSLYLISLIICFDRDRWYKPNWFAALAMLVIAFICGVIYLAYRYRDEDDQHWLVEMMKYDIRYLIVVHLTLFFLACMLCHGEVVRRRPRPEKLTEFYLTISAGGALGGVIVAIVCPLIFATFAELKIGIVLTFALAVGVFVRGFYWEKLGVKWRIAQGGFALLLTGLVITAQSLIYDSSLTAGPKIQLRNFYGALTVRDWYPQSDNWHGRALYHGSILHGYQFLAPGKELTPTTYYTESSGVGLTLRALRESGPIKVGAVGLGAGTVAAYGEPLDVYRFYEINPLIITLAKSSFSFLEKTPAEVQVVPGDARLSLEREPAQDFDALILDAFSGDSIPVHLLTRESLEVYWRHLKPGGVLIVHISNRYVDLEPIVNRLAIEFGLYVAHFYANDVEGMHISSSEWMVLAEDEQVLDHPSLVDSKADPIWHCEFSLWTDDYNNLVEILRTP